MEDRGGFFERVSPHPDGAHPLPRTTKVIEFRQPTHEVRRAPEPHRVVSWQEGSRILRDSQGSARVEVIPITSARPLPVNRQSRPILADPAVIEQRAPSNPVHGRGLDGSYYPVYIQRPRLEPRPVSGEPRQEPYREVRHNERLEMGPPYVQPVYRHTGNEPPATDNQFNPRRGHPVHPHHPEDVIVLE